MSSKYFKLRWKWSKFCDRAQNPVFFLGFLPPKKLIGVIFWGKIGAKRRKMLGCLVFILVFMRREAKSGEFWGFSVFFCFFDAILVLFCFLSFWVFFFFKTLKNTDQNLELAFFKFSKIWRSKVKVVECSKTFLDSN